MRKIYWYGIAAIVGISLVVTFFAPIGEAYKGLAALPGIGGLLAALFQLIRDESAHQKNLQLQNEQQLFNLGATSHMANTVFDKHVQFCEKYLIEVHKAVGTLWKKGPTQMALDHAANLGAIRIEYTAWLTPEINEKLMPFEKAFSDLGAKAYLVEALSGEENSRGQRSLALNEMFNIFKSILDMGEFEGKDEDAAEVGIKNRIREILQVSELVAIREYLIHKAASLKSDSSKYSIVG